MIKQISKLSILQHTVLLIYTLLVILFFFVYMGKLPHITYFHEQHHLFLFSKNYFYDILYSKGLLEYITNFIIQFFYYQWLGCLLLALLLSSVYALTAYSVRRITGTTDYLHLGLIPVIYLFLQAVTVDYNISEIVGVLITISVVAVFVTVISGRLKYPVAIVGCLVLLTFISWKIIMGVMLITSLSVLSAYFIRNRENKFLLIITCLVLIAYAGAGNYFFTKKYRIDEKYMILAKKSAVEKNWDETLSITKRYLAYEHRNLLMAYYHNMALFHAGQLGDKMLDVPQIFGTTSLCFLWRSNSRDTEYGYDAYYELGHWNAALRWAFEAMVVWGETAPCLIKLAECNIKIGKTAVAQNYINVLKQSLFYGDMAKELESAYESEKNREFASDGINADNKARFIRKDNLLWDLELLCDKTPDNRMAFEYYMSALLLNNYVLDFAQNIYRIKAFDYKKMPRIYEEALCICKAMEKEEFDKLGLDVSLETEARFKRYYLLFRQGDKEGLRREFGNSYWYYIHVVSPNGNQILRPEKDELEFSGGEGLDH